MREPTSEECSANAAIEVEYGRKAFACWYPQMGGYVGKCVVVIEDASGEYNSCFDAYVWHDGEFGFGDGERPPIKLHHCDAEQFVRFGELVLRKQAEAKEV